MSITCPVRKVSHPAVVSDALEQVAREFRVEESHGEAEQFHEEIRHERHVHLHRHPQQHAPPEEVGEGPSAHYGQLAEQNQPYESDVAVADSGVHYLLGEEGED